MDRTRRSIRFDERTWMLLKELSDGFQGIRDNQGDGNT